jgi:hypothetical protein
MQAVYGCHVGKMECILIPLDELRKNPEIYSWRSISYWNSLDKEFIIEFSDQIKFDWLLENRFITDDVKEFCRMFL